jgi:hypothetical protein
VRNGYGRAASDWVGSLASRFEFLRPHLSERQRAGCGWVPKPASWARVGWQSWSRRWTWQAAWPDGAPGAVDFVLPSLAQARWWSNRAEAADPALAEALDKRVDPVTRGDPMPPLR